METFTFSTCACVRAESFKLCLTLFNPVNCTCHVPLSMEFSRQEYWSGLPCPPPGDLPYPGIEPASFASLGLAGRFFTTEPPGKPCSVQFGRSLVSESLQPHGPQHARPPCLSPTPRARSKSCPSSWRRHATSLLWVTISVEGT